MSPRKRVLIFVAAVVGFVILLYFIFGSRGSSPTNTPQVKKVTTLTDFIDRDSKMILTVDGRINGDDTHRAVRITVSRGSRLVEVMQGYQGNVIKSQSFENNKDSYDKFVRALLKMNYGKERKSVNSDERGVCPAGRRYVYEVIDNNDTVSRTWSSSCVRGNTTAQSDSVLSLFRAQITDYSKFVNGVNL